MRGKGFPYIITSTGSRITPAYAGKRKIPQIVASKCRDHPRLCGEKSSGIVTSVPPLGSPPPMRGKVGNGLKSNFIHGITPAYAGKSVPDSVIVNFVKDHPRLCGEKSADAARHPSRTRITPAYAGKSWIPITQFFNIQDHPRLCGEKCTRYFSMRQWLGSPPPMRGKGKP